MILFLSPSSKLSWVLYFDRESPFSCSLFFFLFLSSLFFHSMYLSLLFQLLDRFMEANNRPENDDHYFLSSLSSPIPFSFLHLQPLMSSFLNPQSSQDISSPPTFFQQQKNFTKRRYKQLPALSPR